MFAGMWNCTPGREERERAAWPWEGETVIAHLDRAREVEKLREGRAQRRSAFMA